MTENHRGAATGAAQKRSFGNDGETRIVIIRQLNDQFRKSMRGGLVLVTAGVNALGPDRLAEILAKVAGFDDFSRDNDPHGEHEFGAFEGAGERFFWKIDYFDRTLTAGSEDPANPAKTRRALTLMLASEY
jgi:hypothetical protein